MTRSPDDIMRIAYLSASGQMGGAERSLLDVLASVRAARPDWSMHLIVSEDGPLAAKATALGVSSTVLPFPSSLARLGDAGAGGAGGQLNRCALLHKMLLTAPTVISYIRSLRRELHRLSPDVVHSNGFKLHVCGVWARPRRTPLIWHLHDYVRPRPVMSRLLRRHAARCAAIITNSQSVAADVRSVCGAHVPIHTVYNGVDVEHFSPVGMMLDLDALAGLPPATSNTIRVGLLATFARWKGHETFLRALALLPSDSPVRGYVVGGALYQTVGSQRALSELKRLVAQLGISRRVGFTGFVEEPAAAMRALDIIVHASTEPEPFGLVIAEGMACGRAIIASNSGGAAELVEMNVNALVHSPGDVVRLAENIRFLATNYNLRTQLGTAARVTAERRFDRARLATELIPIYRALTNVGG